MTETQTAETLPNGCVIQYRAGGMWQIVSFPDGWVDDLGEPLKRHRVYETRGRDKVVAWAERIAGWQK
jgi:hypothetical protein